MYKATRQAENSLWNTVSSFLTAIPCHASQNQNNQESNFTLLPYNFDISNVLVIVSKWLKSANCSSVFSTENMTKLIKKFLYDYEEKVKCTDKVLLMKYF